MAKNERNLLGQSSLSFEQTMTGNSLRERNDEWNAITTNYFDGRRAVVLNRGSSYVWPATRLNYRHVKQKAMKQSLGGGSEILVSGFRSQHGPRQSATVRYPVFSNRTIGQAFDGTRQRARNGQLCRTRGMSRGWCNLCSQCAV